VRNLPGLGLSSELKHIIVQPGEMYSSNTQLIIQTLLGSCVSACLYDRQNRVAGMNHFLLSAPRYPRFQSLILSDAGRYGVNAMELLINEMMGKGARRSQIRAKVFGAGSVLDIADAEDFFKIAEINQRFIMEFLETERIPLDAADLGGTRGRVIHFDTHTMEVLLRYIPSGISRSLGNDEKKYWKKNVHPSESEILYF